MKDEKEESERKNKKEKSTDFLRKSETMQREDDGCERQGFSWESGNRIKKVKEGY